MGAKFGGKSVCVTRDNFAAAETKEKWIPHQNSKEHTNRVSLG
jgi:hypothetical protein